MLGFITYQVVDLINIAKEKHEWTQERKDGVIDKMKTELFAKSPELIEYQDAVSEYCECFINACSEHFTFDNFAENILVLPEDEKLKILTPLTQECINTFLSKIEPYIADIKFQREVDACAKRAMGAGNLSSKQANEYCECFLSYLYDKYGSLENLNNDSIRIVESEQIKKCLISAENLN